MAEHARLLYGLVRSDARLIEVAKAKQAEREVDELGSLEVLSGERHDERTVIGIKAGEHLLQVRTRGKKLAELEEGATDGSLSHKLHRRVSRGLTKVEQFCGELSGHRQGSFQKMMYKLTVEDEHNLRWSVELLA